MRIKQYRSIFDKKNSVLESKLKNVESFAIIWTRYPDNTFLGVVDKFTYRNKSKTKHKELIEEENCIQPLSNEKKHERNNRKYWHAKPKQISFETYKKFNRRSNNKQNLRKYILYTL